VELPEGGRFSLPFERKVLLLIVSDELLMKKVSDTGRQTKKTNQN